ncbi:MAG: helix-turn-helix domain-containing protein [Pseudomonadota bacterium]
MELIALTASFEWIGMPKRQPAYMESQRELIVSAALRSIREHGIHNASVRMICATAGLSTGAFYVHFDNKEEAVDAALLSFSKQTIMPPPASDWKSFEQLFRKNIGFNPNQEARDSLRLIFEFAGMTLADPSDRHSLTSIEGQSMICTWFERSLKNLSSTNAIALPDSEVTIAKQLWTLASGAVCLTALNANLRDDRFVEQTCAAMKRLVGRD